MLGILISSSLFYVMLFYTFYSSTRERKLRKDIENNSSYGGGSKKHQQSTFQCASNINLKGQKRRTVSCFIFIKNAFWSQWIGKFIQCSAKDFFFRAIFHYFCSFIFHLCSSRLDNIFLFFPLLISFTCILVFNYQSSNFIFQHCCKKTNKCHL